jgi:hypothetical protein
MAKTDADFEALAKEVRYLRDRADIQDCIYRYCRGLDRLDREMALSAYHPDAIDDRGPHIGTPAEFLDWVWSHLKGGTSHAISQILYDINGDEAHTESYITFHVWIPGEETITFGQARYVDRFERRNGRWAIAYREALIDYRGTFAGMPSRDGAFTGRRDKQDRSYARPLGLTEDAKRRLAEKKAGQVKTA